MILSIVIKVLLVLLSVAAFASLLTALAFIAGLTARNTAKSDAVDSSGKEAQREREVPLRAIVLCDTTIPLLPKTFDNEGYTDCAHASRTFGGTTLCPKACLGLGSCVIVCPASAIIISKGKIQINDACSGCGKCIPVCPRGLLRLVPLAQSASVRCAGSEIPGTTEICSTAKNGHILDYHDFPESFFKNLDSWGIIRKKSRSE